MARESVASSCTGGEQSWPDSDPNGFAVCFDKSILIVVVFNGGIVGRVGKAAASNALCRGYDADSAQEVWTPIK